VADKNYKNFQGPVALLRFKLVTSRTDIKSVNPCATILNPFISIGANQEVIYKDVMPRNNTMFKTVLKEICHLIEKLSGRRQTNGTILDFKHSPCSECCMLFFLGNSPASF
jgi:hypothetical protein